MKSSLTLSSSSSSYASLQSSCRSISSSSVSSSNKGMGISSNACNNNFKRLRLIIFVCLIMATLSIESILKYSSAVLKITPDTASLLEGFTLQVSRTTTAPEDSVDIVSSETRQIAPNSHYLPMPNLLFNYEDNTTLQSTSACILFSDDDQRLVEWIAYHYYVAGLRTLIVATNPLSFSKPTPILDRWRPYMNHVVEWSDADFGYKMRYKHNSIYEGKAKEHVYDFLNRQTSFYKSCIRYLQELNTNDISNSNNNGWTWFHDVDEYVTLDDKMVTNASAYMAQPSGLLKAWEHSKTNSGLARNKWLFETPTKANGNATNKTAPCYSISLRLVTTKNGTGENNQTEIDTARIINSTVPDFLDASRFETMKYRYRNPTSNGSLNGLQKSLLDVNRVKFTYNNQVRVHRVTTNECSGYTRDVIFQINHYLGSWRLYARPSDSRRGSDARNWQLWHFKSQLGVPNDTIRPWLKSFVEHVGADLSKVLLQSMPLSPVYSQPLNMSEWVAPAKLFLSGRIDRLPELDQYVCEWLQRYNEAVAKANMTNSSMPDYVL